MTAYRPARHGITTLFDKIRADLLGGFEWGNWEWGDGQAWGGFNESSPYFQRILVGSKNLTANIGPPNIVLVADGGQNFGVPETPGHSPPVQILQSKHVTFTAHCWGVDYAQAEDLADAVLTALHDAVTCGNAQVDGEEWIEEGFDGGGVILVRHFRAKGFGVQKIAMPLERPIDLDAQRTVTSATFGTVGTPYSETDGDMSTDVSIGVTLDG